MCLSQQEERVLPSFWLRDAIDQHLDQTATPRTEHCWSMSLFHRVEMTCYCHLTIPTPHSTGTIHYTFFFTLILSHHPPTITRLHHLSFEQVHQTASRLHTCSTTPVHFFRYPFLPLAVQECKLVGCLPWPNMDKTLIGGHELGVDVHKDCSYVRLGE